MHSTPTAEAMPIETKRSRFESLVLPVWSSLARYCNMLSGEHERAKDLLSETMLLAYQHFEELRDEAAFKAYLFRIASRLDQAWNKRAKREVRLSPELTSELERTRLNSSGEEVERSLEVRELYAALETLPTRQREAVILFEISGLSLAEVQAIQGGSLSGVKSRITRGRETLAKKLGARNPQSDPGREAFPAPTAPPSTNHITNHSFAVTGKSIL